MLKKIQIFCDVTPCQVVSRTNIVPPSSGSRSPIFLLIHLYIHHFSMVGSNFSLHTKDSIFGENIFLYIHSPSPFLHSLHLTSFAPFFIFSIPFILLSNWHSILPSSFLLYIKEVCISRSTCCYRTAKKNDTYAMYCIRKYVYALRLFNSWWRQTVVPYTYIMKFSFSGFRQDSSLKMARH